MRPRMGRRRAAPSRSRCEAERNPCFPISSIEFKGHPDSKECNAAKKSGSVQGEGPRNLTEPGDSSMLTSINPTLHFRKARP